MLISPGVVYYANKLRIANALSLNTWIQVVNIIIIIQLPHHHRIRQIPSSCRIIEQGPGTSRLESHSNSWQQIKITTISIQWQRNTHPSIWSWSSWYSIYSIEVCLSFFFSCFSSCTKSFCNSSRFRSSYISHSPVPIDRYIDDSYRDLKDILNLLAEFQL